ncbi:flagellar basal body rod protein FlgB [Iodidimonas nitroreducens]|uniref:flagellar basal body rod protein FlgB n=1 Tax=Iodidimonas nitroreducens TaxID=1236968 RepID=UPI0028D779D6|nr:flagellar basal body protein [Iodidimonas nitroreducens]
MDLSKIPLMAAIKSRMQWLGQNQTVLSANIANADTPGYRPSKLAEQNFSALVEQTSTNMRANGVAPVALKATQAGHFGAGQASLMAVQPVLRMRKSPKLQWMAMPLIWKISFWRWRKTR